MYIYWNFQLFGGTVKKAKQTKSAKIEDQKRKRKLAAIIGVGTGAVVAGAAAGIAVAVKGGDNSNQDSFKFFETKMDVNLEMQSQKGKTHLINSAKKVRDLYIKEGLGNYSNDDFKRDFGTALPAPYDVTTVFWFDYREDLSSDKVVCEFQYHDPGQTLVKNGRIVISPSTNPPTHKEKIKRKVYSVKGKEFDNLEDAKHATNQLIEKKKMFVVSIDPEGEQFATQADALDKLANILITANAFDVTTVPSPNPDGAYDLSTAKMVPDSSAHKGYLYNGKLYDTKDHAAAAWLAANPTKTAAKKGHAIVLIDIGGTTFEYALPLFSFGSDPTASSVVSNLSWHKVTSGTSTGIAHQEASKSVAYFYIDGQKVQLTRDDGAPITSSDFTLQTTRSGSPSSSGFHHVATFEIDGQIIKAARDSSSATPISRSDITLRNVQEGSAPQSGTKSTAEFRVDNRTFQAFREDGMPIHKEDIHPTVKTFGEIKRSVPVERAEFQIDGQTVKLWKSYDGTPITNYDFYLSAGHGSVAPSEALPTSATFEVGGQVINAVDKSGDPIKASDIKMNTLRSGHAPQTFTGASARVTLFDGQQFTVATNDSSITSITEDSLRAVTSVDPVFKNGRATTKQKVTIGAAHGLDITLPQISFEIDLGTSNKKVTEADIIQSITPLSGSQSVGVKQEISLTASHGIELNKTTLVMPTPAADITPTVSNLRIIQNGHVANPGRGVEVLIHPVRNSIIVDTPSIEFRDPTYTPPLFGSYMASRMYVRNFRDLGKGEKHYGTQEEITLSAAPGVLIKEVGSSALPTESLNVKYREPSNPFFADSAIQSFKSIDGTPSTPGKHQQVQISVSPGITISKTNVTYTTAKPSMPLVLENWNPNDSKFTKFGEHQVVSITTNPNVHASKDSITFRSSHNDVSISQIISRDGFAAHDGNVEVAGTVETAKDVYELWANGAPIVDKISGKNISKEVPFVGFGEMTTGHAAPAPSSIPASDVNVQITQPALAAVPYRKEDAYIYIYLRKDLTATAEASVIAAGASGVNEAANMYDTTLKNIYFTVSNDLSHGFENKDDAIRYIKENMKDKVVMTDAEHGYWEKDDHSKTYISQEDAQHKIIVTIEREVEIDVENE